MRRIYDYALDFKKILWANAHFPEYILHEMFYQNN